MPLFNHAGFDDHELVVSIADKASGLRAIVAVHSTALGPALGGCRMWPYASDEEALADVLRLSRGMSYKNALAGLPLGGGKSVIIGDPHTEKTPACLRAFGRALKKLGGTYYTAEDSGTSVGDMEIIATETQYVAGRCSGEAASGDPSAFTARGVFLGIKESLRFKLERDSLSGCRVAIAGLGNVGMRLAAMLESERCRLTVADIDAEKVREATDRFGADAVGVDRIHAVEAEVFAPCALGGAINAATITDLAARIVAGGANNQLNEERFDEALWKAGILYAPDFVVNAGGVMNVAAEVGGTYDGHIVARQVSRIPKTLRAIFERSVKEHRPPNAVAEEMAIARIASAEARKAAA